MKNHWPLILVIGFLFACSKPENPKFYEETIKRGNIIVSAIEGYKDRTNSFPATLENLVPEFINEVPKSDIDDQDFLYNAYKRNGTFSLGITIEPTGVGILGTKSMKMLEYRPSKDYQENKYTKIHFIHNGWVLETKYRNYDNK